MHIECLAIAMETEDSSSDDNSYANESSSRNSVSGGTTSHHGGANTSKTGRKGDPRMHRAVGARLANPKISLFGALQIGGFEYENDEDANAVDSEQITLAQRKNQLSRRIRLAQKLQATNPYNSNSATPTSQNKVTKWPSKMTGIHHVSVKKRQYHSPTNDLALGQSEGLVASSTVNSSAKVGNKIDCSTNSFHIRARQHPDYHPLMIGVNANAFDSLKNSSDNFSMNGENSQGNGQTSDGIKSLHQTSSRPLYKQSKNSPHPPSAVAVTSLSQTAASLGMTLEQLALTLRSSNNLSKLIVSGPTVTQQQKQLALSIYQSEIRCTYQRAMLLAGYQPDIAQNEHSPEYAQFVIDAWHMEGERLSAFRAESLQLDKDSVYNRESPEAMFQNTIIRVNNHQSHDGHSHVPLQDNKVSCDDNGHNHHGHDHHQKHKNVEEINRTNKNGTKESNGNKGGRHIHRLEGKCGHQPVLHQPTGGKPHIDFVIGDRVECYHNVQPSQDLMWPSNYNCTDLSCNDACGDINIAESASSLLLHNGTSNDLVATTSNMGGCDPKIYDRSEINFESDEWNFDFSNGDSLLGLFKLGDAQLQQLDQEIHKQAPTE